MSIGKSIKHLGDHLSNVIRAGTANGSPFRQAAKNTTQKATRFGLNVGQAVGGFALNTGLKIGAQGAKGALFISDHADEIAEGAKKIGRATLNTGKKVGTATLNEAGNWVRAGGAAAEGIDHFMLKTGLWRETGLNESLVKTMLTKKGKMVLGAGVFAAALASGTKDQIVNRQGSNDGQLYRVTPAMTNPYDLSSQMANGPSMGNAYANNAGATGDLVFALQGYRR